MIYLQDPDFTLYVGNVEEEIRQIADQSTHMVVTSPPYFALRDYDTGRWEGGDEGCDHAEAKVGRLGPGNDPSGSSTLTTNNGRGPKDGDKYAPGTRKPIYADECPACGARRVDEQFGLEASPYEYVDRLVLLFREVWRVLRDDGTVWLNLGDTYAGNRGYQVPDSKWRDVRNHLASRVPAGMQAKSRMLVPQRLAIALADDGWYVRQEIIVDKKNAMPESAEDRPTSSHEQVWLLAKSGRTLYWTHPEKAGTRKQPKADYRWEDRETGELLTEAPARPGEMSDGRKRYRRVNLWAGHDYFYDGDAIREEYESPLNRWGGASITEDEQAKSPRGLARDRSLRPNPMGRNARSVWSMNTGNYPGAHFAVFPLELPERAIRAGTSERGVCEECGAPWVRRTGDVETAPDLSQRSTSHYNTADRYGAGNGGNDGLDRLAARMRAGIGRGTLGWAPTCGCDAAVVPAVVLDLFLGSGTTAEACRKLGRRCVGFELSAEYARLAAERLGQLSLEADVLAR